MPKMAIQSMHNAQEADAVSNPEAPHHESALQGTAWQLLKLIAAPG